MQERMVEGKTEEEGGGGRERGRSCGATFCFASFPKHLGRQRKVGSLLDEKWIRDNTCVSRVRGGAFQLSGWVLVLVYVQLEEEEEEERWWSTAICIVTLLDFPRGLDGISRCGIYRRLGAHTPTA
jgi:hypothetical protein